MAGEILRVGSQTIGAPVLAGGITNGNITTATARPYTLAQMDVDTALTYDAINRKLEIESTLDTVFADVGADVVFNGKKMSVPDAVIMRMSSDKGAKKQVLPLMNPLTGSGRGGTAEPQQGFERNTTLEAQYVYYNEYSQAVAGEKWGVNANQLEVFNYYAQNQPVLSKWFAEDEDKQYHQALLETYAWPLLKTGTGLAEGRYNPNWFIANTEIATNNALYNATASTFRSNLDSAFAAAATGTAGVNANIDLDYLVNLDYYAQNEKRIKPLTINGQKSYLLLLPSMQYRKLLRDTSGQLGDVWTKVSALSDIEQKFPGIVGRVMSLVIIEDQRYPTLETDGAGTHSIEYVEPGNDDARNKTIYASGNKAWDIGFLLGAGALIDWKVTPLHFEMETTEYGKKYGQAAFIERGIQLGSCFDLDTTGAGIKSFGSITCAFSATSVVTTA